MYKTSFWVQIFLTESLLEGEKKRGDGKYISVHLMIHHQVNCMHIKTQIKILCIRSIILWLLITVGCILLQNKTKTLMIRDICFAVLTIYIIYPEK